MNHAAAGVGGHAMTSASTTSISGAGSNSQGQVRSQPRGNSAKYYDIASTILGGSGDVEHVFLNAAKVNFHIYN